MAVVADAQRAVSVLQGLQGRLVASGDPELGEQVASMIDLLASPSFRHLLNLQQSVRELKHHLETGPPGQSVEDFNFGIDGELVVPEVEPDSESDQEPEVSHRTSLHHPFAFENKTFEGDEEAEMVIKKTDVAPVASAPIALAPSEGSGSQPELTRSISLERANEDLEQALRELALGREVMSIELEKQEGRGLGFSVIGLKSENQGELGIFVQQIQKNGVAARDGRLHESDQILAINGALVDSSVSHKQAIGMLQKVRDRVDLIVARGGLQIPSPAKPQAQAHPTLTEGDEESGEVAQAPAAATVVVAAAAVDAAQDKPLIRMDEEPDTHLIPHLEDFDPRASLAPDIEVIDLHNKGSGLGFGIVGVRDIGIVVKTIVPGGAAEEDGRLQSGDIILRIGATDLEGMNSDQVATVLRQSGLHVQLVVARGALPLTQASATPSPTPPRPDVQTNKPSGAPPQGLDLGQGQGPTEPELLPVSPPPVAHEVMDGIESGDVFEVELVKGSQGLGLSIAGFIKKTPEGGETSGIFVKKIADGSAADVNGNVKVGDQIVEVDGVNVQGYDNKGAVDLLRKTGAVVRLRLVRFLPETPQDAEPKIEAQAAPLPDLTPPSLMNLENGHASDDEAPMAPAPFPPRGGDDDMDRFDFTQQDGVLEESFDELSPEEEIAIMALWQGLLGLDKDVVIAQLTKFESSGSLGISLEGTVDIDEAGQEVQPHHYIRSILPEGPVGQEGSLESGDELLEVNGMRLMGLSHDEVVKILKVLPVHVRLVCARRPHPIMPQSTNLEESLPWSEQAADDSDDVQLPDVSLDISMGSSNGDRDVESEISANIITEADLQTPMLPALDDSESPMEYSSQSEPSQSEATPSKDRMWSDEVQYIELEKGDRGLGFSILDYQDPDNPEASVIVIRSLVTGGVAEQDGRLIPGDRLVSVNESSLENCSLDAAVQVLKGAPRGMVTMGVAKPAGGVEEEESQIVSATPALVQESPPPSTTTPMLPDVDISPLAAAVMARDVVEEAQKVVDEAQEEMKADIAVKGEVETPKVEEPAVAAVQVSIVNTAPSLEQRLAKPPDLVTSVTSPDKPPPIPATQPPTLDDTAVPEAVKAPEERAPKMVPLKNTPPSGRKKSNVVLPPTLEETIVLKKTNAGLGLTVSADKSNGVVIKSIIRGGCVQQDGRLAVGDFITGVNGETMRNLNNNTARGVLRKSFLQGTDITVTYIPHTKASALLESGSGSPSSSSPPVVSRPPVPPAVPDSTIAPAPSLEILQTPSSGESEWGEVKTVEVNKEVGKSLGISIVGGRAGGDGQVVQGIFIKHVLDSSPAGRTGQLKTGDRILEVNGCDLREATHDQAVAVIRNASNPMRFQVQSLTVGSPAAILQDVIGDGEVVAVAATVVQAGMESDDNLDGEPENREAEGQSDSESEDEYGYTYKGLSERYSDLQGDLHIIELDKGDRGLGLSLAGNKDRSKVNVFVVGVNPAGAAGKDSRILIGDELLEINGIKVHGHSHQNASSIIGGLAPGLVKCVLIRNRDSLSKLAVTPVIYPNQTSIPTVVSTQGGSDEPDGGGAPAPAPVPEEAPMPTPSDYPNVQTITLNKGPRGLGFAIYEDKDEKGLSGIFVKDVTMGGPAKQEGHLRMKDQILAVNDKSLIGLSKMSAISVLKDTRGAVGLTISSSKPYPSPQPTHALFPALGVEVEGGAGPLSSTQPDVSAGTFSVKAGHGNYFPALDIGDDPTPPLNSFNLLDQEPIKESSTAYFPTPDPAKEVRETRDSSSSSSSFDSEPDDEVEISSATSSESSPSMSSRLDRLISDPVTCPLVKGQKTQIVIDKGFQRGLGFSVIGGTDTPQALITIGEIQHGSPAAKDGRLQTGDQILEIDGLELKSITHEAALNVLRKTGSKVRMLVLRDDLPALSHPSPRESEGGDGMQIFTVVLRQPAGHSLGLSIAGKAGALYISGIASGSVAESSGQLTRGDEILAVNGLAVKNIPQEALATLRQNAEGDVSLRISRRKDGGGARLSMGSFEEVVKAQPVMAVQSPVVSQGAEASLDARTAFLQQQESFGSSSEMPPEETSGSAVKTVTLERGPDGLGFSIVGGYGSPHGDLPIYIKTVFNKGAAAVNKQLKRGDQILSVNGQSLEGATHQKAVGILKHARGQVTLTIVS